MRSGAAARVNLSARPVVEVLGDLAAALPREPATDSGAPVGTGTVAGMSEHLSTSQPDPVRTVAGMNSSGQTPCVSSLRARYGSLPVLDTGSQP